MHPWQKGSGTLDSIWQLAPAKHQQQLEASHACKARIVRALDTFSGSVGFVVSARRQRAELTDVIVEDCVMEPVPLHSKRDAVKGHRTC